MRLFRARYFAAALSAGLLGLIIGSAASCVTAEEPDIHPQEESTAALLPVPPSTPTERLVHRTFELTALGEWDSARALAIEAEDPLLARLVAWIHYTTRGQNASFGDITGFIDANPDWPQLTSLRLNAEEALSDDLADSRLVDWFSRYPPLTRAATMRFADALIGTGKRNQAEELVRETWRDRNFSADDEREFYKRYSRFLTTQDHIARLDRLLWTGRRWEASQMLPRVSAGYRALAVARMRLRQLESGVDSAIRQVPDELQSDPGLLYERLVWRRRNDRDAGAVELLDEMPQDPPYASLWWQERAILSRRALRAGNTALAYRLTSSHRQKTGGPFADAEWLAGWIALRFLGDGVRAAEHFERLYNNVQFPISLARGAYWAGRAREAHGDTAEAERWYRTASAHFTTFYGQLAAGRITDTGESSRTLPAGPVPGPEVREMFAARELVQAAKLMESSPDRNHLRAFVRHLTDAMENPEEYVLLASFALESGRHDLALDVARSAQRHGIYLVDSSWPRDLIPSRESDIDPGLVLALMRQESGFDTGAVSRAGARGLMQLMPATAEMIAGRLDLAFSRERLLSDPDYNVTIGISYLSNMLETFEGSYILALAAYNAGPARARSWRQEFGDFRAGEIDAIDWIEMIPFGETRNYIQRVLENHQVYRAVFGSRLVSETALFESDLR